MHGGASPGGKPGNKNAVKHGLYCTGLLEGEQELFATIKAGELEDDIRMVKIQLRRAYAAQAEFERLRARTKAFDAGFEPYQRTSESHEKSVGKVKSKETKLILTRRKRDFIHDIVRLNKILEKLERARAAILQYGAGERLQKAATWIDELINGRASETISEAN